MNAKNNAITIFISLLSVPAFAIDLGSTGKTTSTPATASDHGAAAGTEAKESRFVAALLSGNAPTGDTEQFPMSSCSPPLLKAMEANQKSMESAARENALPMSQLIAFQAMELDVRYCLNQIHTPDYCRERKEKTAREIERYQAESGRSGINYIPLLKEQRRLQVFCAGGDESKTPCDQAQVDEAGKTVEDTRTSFNLNGATESRYIAALGYQMDIQYCAGKTPRAAYCQARTDNEDSYVRRYLAESGPGGKAYPSILKEQASVRGTCSTKTGSNRRPLPVVGLAGCNQRLLREAGRAVASTKDAVNGAAAPPSQLLVAQGLEMDVRYCMSKMPKATYCKGRLTNAKNRTAQFVRENGKTSPQYFTLVSEQLNLQKFCAGK